MMDSAKLDWARASKSEAGGQLIPSVQGADLFHAYCAPCHGADGAGNGPAASELKKRPPDLTRIAQRNGGIFPEDRIHRIIAGDASPSAHGSSEMPVWGPIFHQVEQDQDWGNVRLQNLVRYLREIQKQSARKK
jgi:mono/diheme cytochrome c family protein